MNDILIFFVLPISIAFNCYFAFKFFVNTKSRGAAGSRTLRDGLRHSDNRVVLMTVLMTLAARVALKDGQVLESEKAVLTSHLGLTRDEFAVSNAMFSEAAELDVSDEDLARQIKKIYPRVEDRRKVLEFLSHIAMADSHFHQEEEKYIENLKRYLDI